MRARGHYGHGFWCGFGFPPSGMRFWSGRPWGFGLPRREDYLHMLKAYKEELEELQRDLFRLGALVANPEGKPTPEIVSLEDTDVLRLEQHIDGLESRLGKLTRFIIPGGTPSSALLHQARAICRRAERKLVALAREEPVPSHATAYLNRMSDLLFVMARLENQNQNVEDTVW